MQALHATPTPNTSYASAVMSRPVMCTIGTQTALEPEAHANTSATTSEPPIKATSPTVPSQSTSYSQATATPQTVRPKQKSGKSNDINLTTLQKSRPHVLPAVAPTRESRDSSSSVESSSLIIDDEMDFAHSKDRNRSPINRSPDGGRKRAKHTGTNCKS